MTSAGGLVPVADGARARGVVVALGPGRRRARRGRDRGRVRLRRRGQLRHGRHEHRRVPDPRAACPSRPSERVVAGFPIRLPALDVHTVGAGGGSIARLDAGGALVVGPRSAGAVPGPACYGRGGDGADGHRRRPRARPHPGRLRVPGSRPARRRRGAARARTRRCRRPTGVVRVVDAAMERAVRVVTVERGVDPRDLALVAFGGAGPLHACAIADALGMRAVIVPPRAGVCSAAGLLCAPKAREVVHSFAGGSLADALARVEREARALVGDGRRSSRPRSTAATSARATSSPCRRPTTFPAEHERRNGHVAPGRAGRGDRGAGAGRRSRRRCASPTCPTVDRARGRRARGRRRARLHDVGARRLARRAARARRVGRASGSVTWIRRRCRCGSRGSRASPTRWARCCAAPRTARTSRSAPTARARCSRPTARCSRRPSTSPCTSVRCRRRCAPRSTRAATGSRPGDQIVVNDPFAGGTHLNDVTFVAPVFADDGTLLGWAANRAHHADLGGMAPGSMPPDATEIFQEGLRIPPVRWTPRGRGARRRRVAHARRTARRPRRAARREPARASRGCASCRSRRADVFDEIVDYGERRDARRDRARCPTASTASTTCSTRPADRGAPRPARICVTRDRAPATTITFDFAGTDAQRAGIGERGRSRDRQRGRVRVAIGRRSRPSRRTVACCDRCACVAPPGSIVAAQIAGRGRRRQRRGEPARRRRVPRRARAGRARPRRRARRRER